MKKKFFLSISIVLIALIVILTIYPIKTKNYIRRYLWPFTPLKVQIIIKTLYDKKYINQFQNDYNVKFLPETQFIKLDFKKINLGFLKSTVDNNYYSKIGRYSFQIELLNDNEILIVGDKGKIFQVNLNNIIQNDQNNFKFNEKKSNIKPYKVLDSFLHEDKIFISFISLKDQCYKFNIYLAPIASNNLNFKKFFTSDQCGHTIQGGRMQYYVHEDDAGILFSTGNNPVDRPKNDAQDLESIYGKILFKSFNDTKKYIVFSLGHRNPQGLYVDKKLILSTEHGPRGGDEINNIFFNKNYGWPISSYGDSYFEKNKIKYKKDHFSHGFKEPVFSFVPSIGISELIKLPNNFSAYWKDNFIVSSLNGSSLYRIKFNEGLNKIISYEKIYIGERVRDLKYNNHFKAILLALENNGQLGIITVKK